jgi:hypothetical protein
LERALSAVTDERDTYLQQMQQAALDDDERARQVINALQTENLRLTQRVHELALCLVG